MFRFAVEGQGCVPPRGAAVVVAPHRSWLDPACVGRARERLVEVGFRPLARDGGVELLGR